MTRKPFAAFGRVLYANYYEEGEVFDVSTNASSRTVLFFSSGYVVAKDKETDKVVHNCTPGMLISNHLNSELKCTALIPTVCWCYDPLVNQGYVPIIEKFTCIRGQRMLINTFTNLFLCEGGLEINESKYVGPYQLAMRDSKKVVLATTDVYGLIFK